MNNYLELCAGCGGLSYGLELSGLIPKALIELDNNCVNTLNRNFDDEIIIHDDIRNIDFSKSDLASGIVNLVGQSIGTNIIFASKSENVSKVVLTGKLTSISEITDIIKEVGKLYKIEIFVPQNAHYATAIAAGCFFRIKRKMV